ncbi:hypothetical protein ACHQM5_021540 [Ranunculus cassubicifolius]
MKPTSQISPTFLHTLLNKTIQTKFTQHLTQIHAQIITNNYKFESFLINNLINVYAKCNNLSQSLLIFSNIPHETKNIITFSSLITNCSHLRKPFEGLRVFNEMRGMGIYPNQFTFSAILPSCGETEEVVYGEGIHCLICKHGFGGDLFVGSALIDMYAKCGGMEFAEKVFDEMPERNLVSWNSLIVGFSRNKLFDRAVEVFRDVVKERLVFPDQVSFSSAFSACANMGGLWVGKQVHCVSVKHGLVALAYVKNSLMDMYNKCGSFEDAVSIFETLEGRDVVTWNVMSMGWVHSRRFEEACNYFWFMIREGISPDEASFSTVLHASANLAALGQGTLTHGIVIKTGFLENVGVSSPLITMYAKCGKLTDARRVFDEIDNRNVVCWTAIIAAYQQHGCAEKVIDLFEEMLAESIKPDYITFVCVLSACSHAGQVEKGFGYFNDMSHVHLMEPGYEHYACIVDMLGRAGQLEEAKRFIESMPIEPDPSVWGALLGACRSYSNLEMAKEVAERLFVIEPNNSGNYVLLSNIYTQHGNGVRKDPGCSWIDIKNKSYVFTVQDKSHAQTVEIYEMLKKLADLAKKKGYVAETQFALNNTEEYKEESLWHHSEKLALAFGLLNIPAGAPIIIKKNLRTCGDCHTVMKLASEIFDREIVVRDINRFHRFSGGLCSCGDYW